MFISVCSANPVSSANCLKVFSYWYLKIIIAVGWIFIVTTRYLKFYLISRNSFIFRQWKFLKQNWFIMFFKKYHGNCRYRQDCYCNQDFMIAMAMSTKVFPRLPLRHSMVAKWLSLWLPLQPKCDQPSEIFYSSIIFCNVFSGCLPHQIYENVRIPA